jgi:hypothetical protein
MQIPAAARHVVQLLLIHRPLQLWRCFPVQRWHRRKHKGPSWIALAPSTLPRVRHSLSISLLAVPSRTSLVLFPSSPYRSSAARPRGLPRAHDRHRRDDARTDTLLDPCRESAYERDRQREICILRSGEDEGGDESSTDSAFRSDKRESQRLSCAPCGTASA